MTADSSLPADASDHDLIRAIAHGDDWALQRLYDRHSPLVLGVALRILADREDAEEILQETFVHAWRRAQGYQSDRASVVTWLLMVARSRAIDRLRARRTALKTAETAHRLDPPLPDTSLEGYSSVLSEERRTRVLSELGNLPGEQRQILEMSFYAGLTQTEIAAATGVPLGTVKTRTLLAMKKLRAALRDEIRELL